MRDNQYCSYMHIYVAIRAHVPGTCTNMLKGPGTLFSREVMGHGNIKFKPLFTTFPYMHINVRKLSKYERLGKMHTKISL